jgi:hypothetical protein
LVCDARRGGKRQRIPFEEKPVSGSWMSSKG